MITLIHRQETMSFFGFPVVRFIDIDDAEAVLRAIRATPRGYPIELILHTPGGLVIAARQIAAALADHDGKVTAVVPHYAMSGGTLVALAADEIVLDAHATLGPVDPQLGQYAAASILAAVERPQRHEGPVPHPRRPVAEGDRPGRVVHPPPARAAPAGPSVRPTSRGCLQRGPGQRHDHPLQRAPSWKQLGLPVKLGVGDEERELMVLYPQPRGRMPAVEYIPGAPPERPGMPRRRTAQRR